RHPEVAYTYATIGSGAAGLGSVGGGEVDTAQLFVKLVPKAERSRSQEELAAAFRDELRRLGGLTAVVYSSGFGGAEKQIQLQLQGDDLDALEEAASRVEAVV